VFSVGCCFILVPLLWCVCVGVRWCVCVCVCECVTTCRMHGMNNIKFISEVSV
jgi:hypothetical protein